MKELPETRGLFPCLQLRSRANAAGSHMPFTPHSLGGMLLRPRLLLSSSHLKKLFFLEAAVVAVLAALGGGGKGVEEVVAVVAVLLILQVLEVCCGYTQLVSD